MNVLELLKILQTVPEDSLVYIEGVGRSQQTLLRGVDIEFDGRHTTVILNDFYEKTSTS